jgi:hypothetical protein
MPVMGDAARPLPGSTVLGVPEATRSRLPVTRLSTILAWSRNAGQGGVLGLPAVGEDGMSMTQVPSNAPAAEAVPASSVHAAMTAGAILDDARRIPAIRAS